MEAWKQQIIGSVKLEEEEPEDGEELTMTVFFFGVIQQSSRISGKEGTPVTRTQLH